MYSENELASMSLSNLQEELKKAMARVIHFEHADGPQYYQRRETEERNEAKRYLDVVSKKYNSKNKVAA